MQHHSRLGCEQGEGKEGGKEKRDPEELPKDFDFYMPVIDVMFKLTYLLANTTTARNKLHSYEVGLTHFFRKIGRSVNSSKINSLNPIYLK